MELVIDQDVKAVAEFMQQNIPAVRLTAVAEAVGKIAPILWSHHGKEDFIPLFLRGDLHTFYT